MVPVFIRQHLKEVLFAVNMAFVALMLAWWAYRRLTHAVGRASTPVIVTMVLVVVLYAACAAFLIGAMAIQV